MNATFQDPKIQRALISVSDKTGVVELAKVLQARKVEILSTGGTAKLLRAAGVTVQEVADYTGFPEVMGGRVKTLHPKIHGGLLARRGVDDSVLKAQGIPTIDLVVVNLYPFSEAIKKPDCSLQHAIEEIDIGGPAMLRSAAKNYVSVAAVVDPKDYPTLIAELETHNGALALETRFELAKKVFAHTAQYDANISNYLSRVHIDGQQETFSLTYTLQFSKKQDLRYGENPHQKAAFYIEKQVSDASVSTAYQHQGKELSFNNIADTNAALECVKFFSGTFEGMSGCVIVKHANPCGVALADTQLQAYQRAFATDPTSAFGGIIAFNQILKAETAEAIVKNQFVEVLVAPEMETEAAAILAEKPNVRVLTTGHWDGPLAALDFVRVNGGMLVQERDIMTVAPNNLKIVSQRQPTVQEFNDLLFAWEVVKSVKSNAIVYAKDRATVGIGAGQMSRVFSAIIAELKAKDAGLSIAGSVMASDAFFPFRDTVDAAAKAGIAAIIQPGGSMRDAEVIQAANEAGIAMVFTGVRHFKH